MGDALTNDRLRIGLSTGVLVALLYVMRYGVMVALWSAAAARPGQQ